MFNIGGELWSWFLLTGLNLYQSMAATPLSLLLNQEYPKVVFIVYMNDIPGAVAHSKVFIFADDTKYFKHITVPSDMQLVQHDLNCLLDWSITSLLSFHPSESTHLSF